MSDIDPYLPGPETPAGQEVRLAAGLGDVLRGRRKHRGFGGPMAFAVGLLILIVVVAALAAVL